MSLASLAQVIDIRLLLSVEGVLEADPPGEKRKEIETF